MPTHLHYQHIYTHFKAKSITRPSSRRKQQTTTELTPAPCHCPTSRPIQQPTMVSSPFTRPKMPINSSIPGSSVPIHTPITGPQTATTIEHLLSYLIAINHHSTVQSTPAVQEPTPSNTVNSYQHVPALVQLKK